MAATRFCIQLPESMNRFASAALSKERNASACTRPEGLVKTWLLAVTGSQDVIASIIMMRFIPVQFLRCFNANFNHAPAAQRAALRGGKIADRPHFYLTFIDIGQAMGLFVSAPRY